MPREISTWATVRPLSHIREDLHGKRCKIIEVYTSHDPTLYTVRIEGSIDLSAFYETELE